MDCFLAEERPKTTAAMLRFSLERFRRQRVTRATTWLQTNTALDGAGRALGFTETGQQRVFCCQVVDSRYDWLADPARWVLTMADAELY